MALICLVHGNAVVPEVTVGVTLPVDGLQGTENTGLARGWGKTFRMRAGATGWFHFALPVTYTTSPLGSYREIYRILDSVSFYWSSDVLPVGGPLGVNRVHVWDGEKRIHAEEYPDPIFISGDWSFDAGRRIRTRWDILYLGNTVFPKGTDGSRYILREGLGLSLHVKAQGEGNITFHSARCEIENG